MRILSTSIELANEAAGIAVGKFGTAIVNRSETRKKDILTIKFYQLKTFW